MPYLGRSSNFGVRSVFHYLPSAGDTSVSGADADGKLLHSLMVITLMFILMV